MTKMLTHNSEHALRMYERRLASNRVWSRRWYEANTSKVLQSQLIAKMRKGRCPRIDTLERKQYDKAAIQAVWLEVVRTKTELSDHAKKFHRYITGSDWVSP